MASIIKVDQIQSDSGNVALTGNVGIGTSTPETELHIPNGAITLGTSSGDGFNARSRLRIQGDVLGEGTAADAWIQIKTNVTGEGGVLVGDTDDDFRGGFIYNNGTDILEFYANNAMRLSINNDGSQSSVIPGGTTLYPEFKCRAWVNFNGTGTVAIRGSGNVTSITDRGTGAYSINFTTEMPDENYATLVTSRSEIARSLTRTTTLAQIQVEDENGTVEDSADINSAIFR